MQNRSVVVRWAVVALLAVGGVAAGQQVNEGMAPEANLEMLQAAFVRLADRMRPSVVAIRAERISIGSDGAAGNEDNAEFRVPSIGSGVIIRADGMILTNEHVVHAAERIIVVLHDHSEHEPMAVYADARSDLAIVQIDADGLTPAPLGDLSRVRPGHWAFAMGNPFGLGSDGTTVVSEGIVSAVGRQLTRRLDPSGMRYYGNLIQTSAAINPGNSGGPLVNLYGEVIGISTAISTRTGTNEGVGFAVPIEARTKAIIEKLIRGEPVEYGFLGVAIRPAPRGAGGVGSGAMIESVGPGSPAEKGNLKEGDIIVELDGTRVEDSDHLVRLVGASPVGERVRITYYRDGRRGEATVELSRRELPPGSAPAELSWRGMILREPTVAVRQQFSLPDDATGLVVMDVVPDSAAVHAGVKPGMRILAVNDTEVPTLSRMNELVPGLRRTVVLRIAEHEPIRLRPR
ncbi:MAG: trypsin-like peptidase domain-containing protein [Phycisphaerae bacterium]|nr:trypsin-like peptidase domain-containing protein [Phycisphaerae bacterium]